MAFVVFALVLASCSPGSVAAKVNGVEITDDDIAALTTDSGDAVAVEASRYRDLVTIPIVTEVMVDAAQKDFGLDDLSTKEALDAYLLDAPEEDIALISSVASNPLFTEDAVDLVKVQLAVRAAVKDKLANDPAFLKSVWQEDQDVLPQACVRHILVATEKEANEAKARYDAGEAFADLASELSLDPQSPGGALPCPSRLDGVLQPFGDIVNTAPIGEMVGPVETSFGWHLIIVDSREAPQDFDEFAQDAQKWIPPSVLDAAWIGWLDESLSKADIEVNSKIGTWSTSADAIVPPPASP